MYKEKAYGLQFQEYCTGCGACIAVCGKKAISYHINRSGFYQAEVDVKECISCGRCADVCPSNADISNLEDFNASEKYIARIKNDGIYRKCSSGGIASAFYLSAIEKEKKIIGSSYDYKNNEVRAEICSKIEEIDRFKGSKYLPTRMDDIINSAINDTSNYLVCGLPCQIYGFRKAIIEKNAEDRFILIELCCHGVPSLNIWKQFLEEINKHEEKITNVSFRSHKDEPGEYTLIISGEKNILYSSKRKKSVFYRLFDDAYCISKACYQCKMNQRYGVGDIRIGDYYKAKSDSCYYCKVYVRSPIGIKFWDDMKSYLTYETKSVMLPNRTSRRNDYIKIHDEVMRMIENKIPLNNIVRAERKMESTKTKMIRFLNGSSVLMKLYKFIVK